MHHYETFTQNDHIRRDENAVSTLEGQPVTQILKDSITEVVEAVAGLRSTEKSAGLSRCKIITGSHEIPVR